jgi:hypothetical protein
MITPEHFSLFLFIQQIATAVMYITGNFSEDLYDIVSSPVHLRLGVTTADCNPHTGDNIGCVTDKFELEMRTQHSELF